MKDETKIKLEDKVIAIRPEREEKPKPMTIQDAMGLNRRERRILGKLNGIKIPGSMKPYVRPKHNA